MYYTFEWRDGNAWLADLDPEVVGELYFLAGEPGLSVTGLIIDGVDIMKSLSPSVFALAIAIRNTIQNDTEWLAEYAEAQGYIYKSRGGTDPDARWELRA